MPPGYASRSGWPTLTSVEGTALPGTAGLVPCAFPYAPHGRAIVRFAIRAPHRRTGEVAAGHSGREQRHFRPLTCLPSVSKAWPARGSGTQIGSVRVIMEAPVTGCKSIHGGDLDRHGAQVE